MINLSNFISKRKIKKFFDGIHPPSMKKQSSDTLINHLPLPKHFFILLKQHIGYEGEICISPGDRVLRGQPLTSGDGYKLPVHAPTSGIIDAIEPYIAAHPSGLSEYAICLSPDKKDRWISLNPLPHYQTLQREIIIKLIHKAGISGMGGAGFPTATKLRMGINKIKTLIINAAECEPYITADDLLIQNYASEILEGCKIIAWIMKVQRILIGIANNKPKAIKALKDALINNDCNVQLCIVPIKYPCGSSKHLIKILTGLEVPHGGHSIDIGILMYNIGTIWAVKRAIINGEPMTERIVTITGGAVFQPCNAWVRLGTPIEFVLSHVSFKPSICKRVIMGGPLMGFTLPSLKVPVVKYTNCILAMSAKEVGKQQKERSCIRCGICADVCPMRLLPQQLYWYSLGSNHNKTRLYNINDCIECGSCAYVCPSRIPLVLYFRREKANLYNIDLDIKRNLTSKLRFEARQKRLKLEKYNAQNKNIHHLNFNIFNTTSVPNIQADKQNKNLEFSESSRKSEVEKAIARAKSRKEAKKQAPFDNC